MNGSPAGTGCSTRLLSLLCFVAIRFIECIWLIDALRVGTKTGDPYIGSTRFCSFS